MSALSWAAACFDNVSARVGENASSEVAEPMAVGINKQKTNRKLPAMLLDAARPLSLLFWFRRNLPHWMSAAWKRSGFKRAAAVKSWP